MAGIGFKQFSQPDVLREIGRELLRQFLEPFQAQLAANKLALPPAVSSDTEYFSAVADALKHPAEIPPPLCRALFAIEDLASPDGQERLQAALERAGPEFNLDWNHCPEQAGIRLWLEAPALVLREHENGHALPLTSFECFGAKSPAPAGKCCLLPDRESLSAVKANLDRWFAAHQRGRETTRIDVHSGEGGISFQVRHADLLTWTHKIEDDGTDSIQVRRKKTDSIVYSSEHDEIRICAETLGERELYRREFSLLLRGNTDYFSKSTRYTLEPLRWERAHALDAQGVAAIRKISLKKIEIDWCNVQHEVNARAADDSLRVQTMAQCELCGTPSGGRLSRASFLIQFCDSDRPRAVEVIPPNTLNLERPADGDVVTQWLSRSWLLVADQVHHHQAEAV